MPGPMVVAAADRFAAARRPVRPHSQRLAYDPGEPAVLPMWPPAVSLEGARSSERLLGEATTLARSLGCAVRRRWLGGHSGGGFRWNRGRLRIVLDVESAADDRLAVIADALRGEPRLCHADMSRELAEYLTPRRAA
ncbi:MAG: hypothetical protein AAF805_09090 [Planctomycetota bacterium]